MRETGSASRSSYPPKRIFAAQNPCLFFSVLIRAPLSSSKPVLHLMAERPKRARVTPAALRDSVEDVDVAWRKDDRYLVSVPAAVKRRVGREPAQGAQAARAAEAESLRASSASVLARVFANALSSAGEAVLNEHFGQGASAERQARGSCVSVLNTPAVIPAFTARPAHPGQRRPQDCVPAPAGALGACIAVMQPQAAQGGHGSSPDLTP